MPNSACVAIPVTLVSLACTTLCLQEISSNYSKSTNKKKRGVEFRCWLPFVYVAMRIHFFGVS
jgi:hypothetical protein